MRKDFVYATGAGQKKKVLHQDLAYIQKVIPELTIDRVEIKNLPSIFKDLMYRMMDFETGDRLAYVVVGPTAGKKLITTRSMRRALHNCIEPEMDTSLVDPELSSFGTIYGAQILVTQRDVLGLNTLLLASRLRIKLNEWTLYPHRAVKVILQ
jgi:hypothetical protein